MDEIKIIIKALISLLLLSIALLQWYIIGERTIHAIWMQFKTQTSTTIQYETMIQGYIGTLIVLIITFLLKKSFENQKVINRVRLVSIYMLGGGLVWLTVLISTPLARVVSY